MYSPLVVPSETKVDVSKFVEEKPWSGEYSAFNLMIYGDPGIGKTPLVCTVTECESMLPALLIDCDEGTLSVQETEMLDTIHLTKMSVEMSREDIDNISAWNALEEIYRWLRFGDHKYRTIILDGGTEVERHCELSCITHGTNYKKSGDHDPELAELADYRRIQDRMTRMYKRFRDLRTRDSHRVNFIATAHEGKRKDENSGKIMSQPLYIGAGTTKVQSAFDIIGRLTILDNGKKRIIWKLQPTAKARDRSGNLGDSMDDPSMAKIYEKVVLKR
jgi:hypothetical protein